MKRIIIFCFISFLLIACEKEEPPCACGIENPQENIEWLALIIKHSYIDEISSITYDGIEYIVVTDYPTVLNPHTIIYDCQGKEVCVWALFNSVPCELPIDFTWIYENKILIYKQP